MMIMSKRNRSLGLIAVSLTALLACSCQTLHPKQQQAEPIPRPPRELAPVVDAEPVTRPGSPDSQVVAASFTAPADEAQEPSPADSGQRPAAPEALPGRNELSPAAPLYPQAVLPPSCPTCIPPPRIAPCPTCKRCKFPNECLCNGGDNFVQVRVADDWSVHGLHEGDTIAHYDTVDGHVEVVPSNEVCLYAPRFAAVRKVAGVVLHEQHQRMAGVEKDLAPILSAETQIATTVIQPQEPVLNVAFNGLNRFRDKTRGTELDNAQRPALAEDGFLPHEDLLIVRRGIFDASEKARLAASLDAAIVWTHEKAVQVVIDNVAAVEDSNKVGTQAIYHYEMPPGKPRLRICKLASKKHARPGELVDFTLRFDNVGDQTIGNVTIIDNLNTRLEYVPDSQECSLTAEFSTQRNEHESLVLRWEITDPMKVGEGGIIRFQCRVR